MPLKAGLDVGSEFRRLTGMRDVPGIVRSRMGDIVVFKWEPSNEILVCR